MKTIDNLRFGDSVWFEGNKYKFGGFDLDGRLALIIGDHQKCAVSKNHTKLSLLPDLQRGQPVWVRDIDDKKWEAWFFMHFRGDRCFAAATWSSAGDGVERDQWKLPFYHELVKAGFNPERWKYTEED